MRVVKFYLNVQLPQQATKHVKVLRAARPSIPLARDTGARPFAQPPPPCSVSLFLLDPFPLLSTHTTLRYVTATASGPSESEGFRARRADGCDRTRGERAGTCCGEAGRGREGDVRVPAEFQERLSRIEESVGLQNGFNVIAVGPSPAWRASQRRWLNLRKGQTRARGGLVTAPLSSSPLFCRCRRSLGTT